MNKYSEALVGVDTAKKKHAVAIGDAGHDGARAAAEGEAATHGVAPASAHRGAEGGMLPDGSPSAAACQP
jgi:hypothetical protein